MTAAASTGQPRLVVAVAGPTCSGKSALAMALAQRLGGVVIHADSMQIYRELRILTARPSEAEERAIPHRLYGVRPAAEAGSVAWWAEAATAEIEAAHAVGLLPILCGGTGLYFSALKEGLAFVPEIGAPAREEARSLLVELGAQGLYERLAAHDPRSAATLRPSDSQRIARAWEVWRQTGRGLANWRDAEAPPTREWSWRAVILDPPRDTLRQAIRLRFAAMLEDGALEEVRALLALGLDPALPAMRAHGVPELCAVLRGTLTLQAAAAAAALATGQYTKRQATWFRRRHIAAETHTHRLNARIDDPKTFSDNIEAILKTL